LVGEKVEVTVTVKVPETLVVMELETEAARRVVVIELLEEITPLIPTVREPLTETAFATPEREILEETKFAAGEPEGVPEKKPVVVMLTDCVMVQILRARALVVSETTMVAIPVAVAWEARATSTSPGAATPF